MLPFFLYYLYFLSPLLTSIHVIRPSSSGITPYEALPRKLLTPEKKPRLPLYPMMILAGYTSMTVLYGRASQASMRTQMHI